MIRNESEYREAAGRLQEESRRIDEHRKRLRDSGLSKEEIKRVIDPIVSFHLQLKEEVEGYERLKRGEFEALHNFDGMGRMLIAFRIWRGLSQRELAERLEVHESQVSRDERNEYAGVSVERVGKTLDALDIEMRTVVEVGRRSRKAPA